MKKVVNVTAIHPISGVSQIVRGRLKNATMSTEDIFKCLCAKATVVEVLGDKLIPLNFDNYNKDNKPVVAPVVVPTAVTPKSDPVLQNYDKKNVDLTDTPKVEETKPVEETVVVTETTTTETVSEPVVDTVVPEENVTVEADVTSETTTEVATEEVKSEDVAVTEEVTTEETTVDDSIEDATTNTENRYNNHKKHKK